MMLAKQYSKNKNIFCTAETPLPEVYRIMMELRCECMPIVESTRHRDIIGIITEHDICRKTIQQGLNPQKIKAGRVMNGDFISVSSEASIKECADLMYYMGIERLFVVNENCGFEGILTKSDLPTENVPISVETIVTDLTEPIALPQSFYSAH